MHFTNVRIIVYTMFTNRYMLVILSFVKVYLCKPHFDFSTIKTGANILKIQNQMNVIEDLGALFPSTYVFLYRYKI